MIAKMETTSNQCSFCNSNFAFEASLKEHNKNPFEHSIKDVCGKNLKSEKSLKAHFQNHEACVQSNFNDVNH